MYSILIPSYDPELKKKQMFLELIDSIEENSKGKDYELIIRKNGRSYTESHNDALKSARGDFLIILNDDVLIQDPEWLEKMTIPNAITSWRLGEFGLTKEVMPDFACWGMSREVFEQIGLFDERFKDGFNFEDNDYAYRARELEVPFVGVGVKLTHYGDQTATHYSHDKWGKIYKNEAIFNEKWKHAVINS